jgi:outer membrane protein assembly factor BamB
MMRLSKSFVWFLTLLGLAVFGYGFFRSNYDIRGVLSFMPMLIWPLVLFTALGVTLLWWSIKQARWNDPNKSRSWPVQIVVGVFFLFMVAVSMILNWRMIYYRFAGDQMDEARMAQLASANLDSSITSSTVSNGTGQNHFSGDWPAWRGPNRDGKSTETSINTDWQKSPPKTLWRRSIGGGYSSIAAVGDRIYTMDRHGTEERVVCLAADTGKDLWAFSYPVDWGKFGYNSGPRATPTIAGGRLYSVGATGIFVALELPTSPTGQPKEAWRHDLIAEFNGALPQWGVACSPLVEGDLVIVQPGGSKGSVAAFNQQSGALVWSALSDVNGYSSPVVADIASRRQVVVFTGEGIAGLDVRDGNKLWYYDWPEQFNGNIATPIAAGNFVFISSVYTNGGCALLEISQSNGQFQANPVYVKRNKLMRNHHASCVLHQGFLYGFDSLEGIFKCIDLRTATEKWYNRKPGKGSLMFADSHLIILTEKGELTIAAADPERCTLKGKIEVFDRGETWAVPVLSRGKLFVRDKEEIVCLDLRKPVTQ